MITFTNGREFNSRILNCQLCGNKLSTVLMFQNKTSRFFYTEYHSNSSGDFIHFYNSLSKNEKGHPILSIHIDTNEVIGDLHEVQNIIWNQGLRFVRGCSNKICYSQGYVCESTPLVLERKKKIIYPFHIDTECINITINNKKYVLANDYRFDTDKTTLIYYSNSNSTKIPRINLHSFRDKKHIIDKVKTILVFL